MKETIPMLMGIGAILTLLAAVPVTTASPMYVKDCQYYPTFLGVGNNQVDITCPYIPSYANNAWSQYVVGPLDTLLWSHYSVAFNDLTVDILSGGGGPAQIYYCYTFMP